MLVTISVKTSWGSALSIEVRIFLSMRVLFLVVIYFIIYFVGHLCQVDLFWVRSMLVYID